MYNTELVIIISYQAYANTENTFPNGGWHYKIMETHQATRQLMVRL